MHRGDRMKRKSECIKEEWKIHTVHVTQMLGTLKMNVEHDNDSEAADWCDSCAKKPNTSKYGQNI